MSRLSDGDGRGMARGQEVMTAAWAAWLPVRHHHAVEYLLLSLAVARRQSCGSWLRLQGGED